MKLNKKLFTEFYSVGDNRYYKACIHNEEFLCIGTKLNQKGLFGRKKEVLQNFEMLKVTPSIMLLFKELLDTPIKSEKDDIIKYEKIKISNVKSSIKAYYRAYEKEQISLLEREAYGKLAELEEDDANFEYKSKKITDTLNVHRQRIEEASKLKINNLLNPIIETEVHNFKSKDRKVLVQDVLGSFAKFYTLIDSDEFGKVTIYQIITAKGVIKMIKTYLVDKNIVESYLNLR